MGNNCVAGGGTPHRCDIVIANNTDLKLRLDSTQKCQRDCDHRGFQIACGKIVLGAEPPAKIGAHQLGRFSVSGREGSAVAPEGKVFYSNQQWNLHIVVSWANASSLGATPPAFTAVISGKPKGEGQPWNEVLTAEADYTTWTVSVTVRTLRTTLPPTPTPTDEVGFGIVESSEGF